MSSYLSIISQSHRLATERHLVTVAKRAGDLVLGVHQECLATNVNGCLRDMSQVVAVGFKMGAHIAGKACKYLKRKTGDKVEKLIGKFINMIFHDKKY